MVVGSHVGFRFSCVAGAVVAAAACAWTIRDAVGGSRPAATAGTCRWHTVATPDPPAGHENQLVSVTAPAADVAWAVGNYFSGYDGGPHGPIVARWDGRGWTLVPNAAPAGGELSDVSADSPRDVWIVGSADAGNRALVEHWNGHRWTRTPIPRVARFSHLFGVDARTPRDVWAVGNRSDGRTGQTLVMHWDGSRWRVTPSPSPPPSPATGRPYAGLESVSALSADDVWAVGETGNVAPPGAELTLILHWDGRRWSHISSSSPRNAASLPFDALFAVDAAGPDDVWAVGDANRATPGYGGGGDRPLVERWDGRRWRLVSSPLLGRRSILYGVLAAGSVWVVGDRGEPYHTVAQRRSGDGWRTSGVLDGSLADVARAPDGRLWAVGQRGLHTLALSC